jgi:CheY-like chemotaxis protein
MYLKDGSPVQILLVEGDADIQQMFTELFATLGCTVHVVSNCTEALKVVPEVRPNIVFSSLIFNDMSGLDLCTKLRTIPELEETIFVALTGYSNVNIRQTVRDAGFHHYLLKPASFSTLLEPFMSIPSLDRTEILKVNHPD